jgi:phenylalanyl-tRNA synthetase beta chain
VKISRAWLQEFVDLPDSVDELVAILDDLGLVVEGVERVGEGLGDVVAARVLEIHPIEGADKIRRVMVDAGGAPLQIVCGAQNFAVGDYVPLAPVGAVLPGDFAIAERKMKGVTSFGMLCSGRELGLGDDHAGLLVLNDAHPEPGAPLLDVLGVRPDVVFALSVEGNRPDAWSVEGVARDVAVRRGVALREPVLDHVMAEVTTATVAAARIDADDLCGRLTVSVLRGVAVGPSPQWVQSRLQSAGMRPINNVVDASNLVMLELGQPTHPYDLAKVAGGTLVARRAHAGEILRTLDGTERTLGLPMRGLGDVADDCVIADGDGRALGIAGVMGGAESEIDASTTEVLLEAAFFTPIAIARTSKRLGLRSEASNRFERGVDPGLALRAVARFVHILRMTCPALEWFAAPIDARGVLPERPTVALTPSDVARLLGTDIPAEDCVRILRGLRFDVDELADGWQVIPPSARLDIRDGAAGQADIIEEIARLFSYRRLERRVPSWPAPGGFTPTQHGRRALRAVAVGLGFLEAWTPTLGDDVDFDHFFPGVERVRVTNPLAVEESVLRASLVPGLVRVWARNAERGVLENFFEIGSVMHHPSTGAARTARGGVGGTSLLSLPLEVERLTMVLGRDGTSAPQAVGAARVVADRLGLRGVRIVTASAPAGWHRTRYAEVRDEVSGAVLGAVGEVDPDVLNMFAGHVGEGRRVAVADFDLEALLDEQRATRRPLHVRVPSRFPAAHFDLAFLVPASCAADDLRVALADDERVELVELFDHYDAADFGEARSLSYRLRASLPSSTIDDATFTDIRDQAIARAGACGATLR